MVETSELPGEGAPAPKLPGQVGLACLQSSSISWAKGLSWSGGQGVQGPGWPCRRRGRMGWEPGHRA